MPGAVSFLFEECEPGVQPYVGTRWSQRTTAMSGSVGTGPESGAHFGPQPTL